MSLSTVQKCCIRRAACTDVEIEAN